MTLSQSFYALTLSFAAFYMTGCGSTAVSYMPPLEAKESTTVILRDPFEAAWAKSVRALSESFFVLNDVVKDSRLINLYYSGDPEKYVDCGHVALQVHEPNGAKTYEFPGARRNVRFKTVRGLRTSFVNRQMTLESQINIIFEEVDKIETAVTIVVHYALTRTGTETVIDRYNNQTSTEQLPPLRFRFNTGENDSTTGQTLKCRPTGEMERSLIDILTFSYTQ